MYRGHGNQGKEGRRFTPEGKVTDGEIETNGINTETLQCQISLRSVQTMPLSGLITRPRTVHTFPPKVQTALKQRLQDPVQVTTH